MTIGTSTPRVSFACDGATKIFPVPIQAYLAADFTVILTAPVSAGGGEAILTLNSDYSLVTSGTLSPTAWTLTTLPAAAYLTGYTLQVFCNPVQTQQTQYVQGQAFPSLAIQTNVDRLTQMVLRLQDQVNRALRVPDGDVNPLMLLPTAAQRANLAPVFDVSGNIVMGVIPTAVFTQPLFNNFLTLAPPYIQTQAELTAGVTPSNYLFTTQPYDLRRYGQKLDNVTDDTAAVNTGLLVAGQIMGSAQGAAVSVTEGTSLLSSMVLLPNRVRVLGNNKRGSYFKATGGWAVGNGVAAWSAVTNYVTGNFATSVGVLYVAKQASLNQAPPNATYWNPISSAMFYAQNGYTAGVGNSMFDSTLENVSIDANNVTGLGCVLSSAWQEDCGLRGALLLNFGTYGVKFQDGFGGSSLARITDCEIFGGTVGGTIGIDLSTPMGISAAFMLDVSDTSITGGLTNLAAGISVKGNSLFCRGVHFEVTNIGVLVDGSGYISLDDLTGASTVTSLVTIAATFTGTLVMKNCRRNGATNFINDLRAGGYGAIGFDEALMVIDATGTHIGGKGLPFASAWCEFDGTVAGTNAPAAGFNVPSVTRNGAGDYSITLFRQMQSSNAACFGSCNLVAGAGSAITVRTDLSTSSSFRVRIYQNGVLTDSNEVKAIIFGG